MRRCDEFVDATLLALLLDSSLYSDIISTKTFKRLKNISFLGAIDYTSYNKKRHNRYDHSISVATLALHYATLKHLDEHETKHLVIAALLHDVGHGPLSHSMEPVFQKRYGISHHSMTNDIIQGVSKLGDELYQVLKKHHINIDYIVALLDGKVSNETAFALSNPINIDTADGIIRTISYAYSPQAKKAHLALLFKPKEIIEALVHKNKRVLDEFWSLKHRVYLNIIHNKENLKADVLSMRFAEQNSYISKDDFYLTDKAFKVKYNIQFEKMFKSNDVKSLEYKQRAYYLAINKNTIDSDEEIFKIYKSKREPKVLNLLSPKSLSYQGTLF